MPEFLSGSLLVNIVVGFAKVMLNAYNESRLKRFVDSCMLCWQSSLTHDILRRYLYKNPYFEYSVTYKVIMLFAGLFDKLFGAVGGFFTALTSGSVFADTAKALSQAKLCSAAVVCLFISIGCAFGLLLKGSAAAEFIAPAAVAVLALLLFAAAKGFDKIRESFIYGIIADFIKNLYE